MSNPKRSALWTVFTETHKADCIATCTICSQELSYRSTTSNLLKHLKRKHPGVNLGPNCAEDGPKEVEVVIERQSESDNRVESFKVEVKPVSEEETIDFIVLGSGRKASKEFECEDDYQEQLSNSYESLKNEEIENIENNPNPPINNAVNTEDDNFWNTQEHETEFRPTPEPDDNFDLKIANGYKRRSQIWNVFTEKPGSEYVALCNVCKLEFCYRSTTNNLKKHFQRKHPQISMAEKIELVKPEQEHSEVLIGLNIKTNSSDDETNDNKSIEKKSTKRPRSQIWNYFTKKKSVYTASCNICKKDLGYRTSTSNLKKHLNRRHPEVGFVKSEADELEEATQEIQFRTCLICLKNESPECKEFIQVNTSASEEKSYMNKIQELLNQPVDIDESHVVCQPCVDDLEKVLEFKSKILKAFEFWSKIDPETEPEEPAGLFEDDTNHTDYSDMEDGESLAKFTCSKCHKVFPSSSVMLKHACERLQRVKFFDNRFYCEHCGKDFPMKWKLTKHLKNCPNVSIKAFVCSMCDRQFKKAYHLREHMASHTGERNYSCNICGKTFQRSSSKHKHIRSHNAKPGEKSKKTPFLCTICGKSFPYSNGASRHMRVHLGERRHECNICLKRFSQTTHLKVHLRTHSGERPYNCLVCGRTFSLNASLRKHMRLHVGPAEYIKFSQLDTNMEENLTTLTSNIEANLEGNNLATLATNLGVMEGHLEDNLDGNMETEIGHTEVVGEDGLHVLTHHDIAIEGSHCAE
ncbi:unnamed protein product [Phyllotreta striolata]|uniref:Uncharacterized protein n=1 Tax=Phyllotreta striolata TaxID=444603 RepID=A0A9N9TBD6_PHYSR|nr:unnamed protein product [Phyllotreta striolata]